MAIKTSGNAPIRVDFLQSEEFPFLNRLGMTFAPGKKQVDAMTGLWDRDLKADLIRLREQYCAGLLISLVEDNELESLKIPNLVEQCETIGISVVRFPIPDQSIPSGPFLDLVEQAVAELHQEKTVVVHCKGGLGRAGTVTACVAIAATRLALQPDDAISLVRAARNRAIENKRQEKFVRDFPVMWRWNDSETEILSTPDN